MANDERPVCPNCGARVVIVIEASRVPTRCRLACGGVNACSCGWASPAMPVDPPERFREVLADLRGYAAVVAAARAR